MKHKQTALSTAITTLVGAVGLVAPMTASAILPDGNYRMVINNTPYVNGNYQHGSDGAWESSFTFGNYPGKPAGQKASNSQSMYDNGDVHPSAVTGHPLDPGDPGNGGGSGILGDGVAGVLDITVVGSSVTINTFNKDVIYGTAGGSFFQKLGPDGVSLMSGTITGSDFLLDPTGRLGSVNGGQPLIDKRWLVDDCEQEGCAGVDANGLPISTGNTAWTTYSTTTAANSTGVVNGTPLTLLGDISGTAPAGLGFAADNRDDYSAVLVAGGWIGSDWKIEGSLDAGFFGAQFFEIWNVTFYSLIQANDDAVSTNAGVAVNIPFQANDTTPFLPFVVENISTPANGAVVDNGDGTFTYTPAGAFIGTDTFTYTVSDADPGADPSNPLTYTSQATVTVTVSAVGTPNANDDSAATDQNTSVAVDVLNNDDAGGVGVSIDATSVIASAGSNGGTAVDAVTGVVTYTPNTDFVGVDAFTYTVDNDVPNTSNTATVTVTVSAASTSSAGVVAQGTAAAGSGVSGVSVTAAELGSADSAVTQQCIGGCFDFVVTGVGNGATINVFLPPLSTAVPVSDPVTGVTSYRKLQGATWVDFDLANVATSALNAFGACSSNAADYTGGLNAGDNCVMLTLTDGSLAGGDSDGIVDGIITDPGGIGIAAGTGLPSAPSQGNFDSTDGQGCTLGSAPVDSSSRADWWLVAGFLALLGWKKRRKFTA